MKHTSKAMRHLWGCLVTCNQTTLSLRPPSNCQTECCWLFHFGVFDVAEDCALYNERLCLETRGKTKRPTGWQEVRCCGAALLRELGDVPGFAEDGACPGVLLVPEQAVVFNTGNGDLSGLWVTR